MTQDRGNVRSPRGGSRGKFVLWALLAVGLVLAAHYFDAPARLRVALDGIARLGPWGPALFALLYVAATVFFLPGSILTVGAGVVFGLVRGFVIVSISATLGATAAFLVGRYLARGWIAGKIEGHPKFKAIDEAVAREGWKIVALLRLSPVVPFNVLNYAFGVTRVVAARLRARVVDRDDAGHAPVRLPGLHRRRSRGRGRPGEPHPRRVGVLRRGPRRDDCRDRIRDAPGAAGARRACPLT